MNLIKRIDAWIDSYTRCGGEADQIGIRIMQECKAALEAKGEPVAWYAQDNLEVKYDTEVIWGRSKPVYAEVWIPLYTAPPSVDALIAEIDGLERIDFDEGGCDYPCSDGDNYRFDDVRAVLNKYRSAK